MFHCTVLPLVLVLKQEFLAIAAFGFPFAVVVTIQSIFPGDVTFPKFELRQIDQTLTGELKLHTDENTFKITVTKTSFTVWTWLPNVKPRTGIAYN